MGSFFLWAVFPYGSGHEKRRREVGDEFENYNEDEHQSHHFQPPPDSNRCVFKAGRRWRNKIRKQRINKWKEYNFLGKHKIDDYLSDDTDDETPSNPTQTPPSSPSRPNKRQATMNSWLSHQQKTSDSQSTTNQRPLPLPQSNVADTVSSTHVNQLTPPSSPPRPTKRQATMNSWLGHQQKTPASQPTTNQRPLLLSQPNVTDTVTSTRINQTSTRQSNMSTWLNQNTQRRPRSQTSPSPEENASPSQQHHEPHRPSSTSPNPRRTPRDLATLNSALASEGSQIFKRRRLK